MGQARAPVCSGKLVSLRPSVPRHRPDRNDKGSITDTGRVKRARARRPCLCSASAALARASSARDRTDRMNALLYLRDVIAECGGLRCPRAVLTAVLRGAERTESGAERARSSSRSPTRLPVITCQNKGRLFERERKNNTCSSFHSCRL